MWSYILKRVLESVGVILGVTLITFLALHMGGDPTYLYVSERASEEEIAAAFFITPAVVKQRLRLTAVSPKLLDLYAAGELVGGLYGVSFERVFCGESMFSRADNASKVALAWLVALMRHAGYRLLDCQFITDHLASLGAVTVPRKRYLQLLADARADGFQASLPDAWSAFAGAQFSAAGSSAGAAGAASAAGAAAAGAALPEPVDRATGASSPGKLIAQSLTHTS